MIIRCTCGKKLKIPPSLTGSRFRCKRCGAPVNVPRETADQSGKGELPVAQYVDPQVEQVSRSDGPVHRTPDLPEIVTDDIVNNHSQVKSRVAGASETADGTRLVWLLGFACLFLLAIISVAAIALPMLGGGNQPDGNQLAEGSSQSSNLPEPGRSHSGNAETRSTSNDEKDEPESANGVGSSAALVGNDSLETAIEEPGADQPAPVEESSITMEASGSAMVEGDVADADADQPGPQSAVAESPPVQADVVVPDPVVVSSAPVVVSSAPVTDERGQLSQDQLDRFKAATVFIIAGDPARDRKATTGSGFLISEQDGAGYIATNAHVIGDFDRIRVYFNSGSSSEYELRATPVAKADQVDLAVLKVTPRKDKPLPQPISLETNPNLRETLDVFVIGYPFGRMLSGQDGNPAPTIGRGFVSSLRRDEHDQVVAIQIDGAINPGNSGGPILDRQGRLVGIATATVRGAQIGLAVPPVQLTSILKGRITGVSVSKRGRGHNAVVSIEARSADPMEHISEVKVVYGPRPDNYESPDADDEFGFEQIGVDGELSEMILRKRQGSRYECDITIDRNGADGIGIDYVFQPVVTDSQSKLTRLEPFVSRVRFDKRYRNESDRSFTDDDSRVADNEQNGTVPDPEKERLDGWIENPVTPNKPKGDVVYLDERKGQSVIANGPGDVEGITVTKLDLEAEDLVANLLWSENAESFFALTKKGRLMKVSFPGFELLEVADLQQPCTWLGMSKLGVCVAAGSDQDLVIFDETGLREKKRVSLPSPATFGTGRESSLVFAPNGRGMSGELLMIDLEKGEAIRSFSTRDFRDARGVDRHPAGVTLSAFKWPTMTPDGKYLFCVGFECLHRFSITNNRLNYDQMGPRIGSNAQRICISHDSNYVSLPSGGGNRGQSDHPAIGSYGTYIYNVADITSAATSITPGAYPRCIGYDPAANLIYGQNSSSNLIVFSAKGLKQKSYNISDDRNEHGERQFLVHPDGQKILLLTDKNLYYAELD